MKHPGKTRAQRRVLDEIGCGNHAPYMANATRDKLLRDGLIVELSPLQVPVFGSLCMTVQQFDMPIAVHMQWCASMDDEPASAGEAGTATDSEAGVVHEHATGKAGDAQEKPGSRKAGAR